MQAYYSFFNVSKFLFLLARSRCANNVTQVVLSDNNTTYLEIFPQFRFTLNCPFTSNFIKKLHEHQTLAHKQTKSSGLKDNDFTFASSRLHLHQSLVFFISLPTHPLFRCSSEETEFILQLQRRTNL